MSDTLPSALADELSCVAAWLDKEAAVLRLVHSDGGLMSAYPPLPSFEPVRRDDLRRGRHAHARTPVASGG